MVDSGMVKSGGRGGAAAEDGTVSKVVPPSRLLRNQPEMKPPTAGVKPAPPVTNATSAQIACPKLPDEVKIEALVAVRELPRLVISEETMVVTGEK